MIKAPIIPVIKNPLDTSNYEHYEDEDGTDWARYNDKKKNVTLTLTLTLTLP